MDHFSAARTSNNDMTDSLPASAPVAADTKPTRRRQAGERPLPSGSRRRRRVASGAGCARPHHNAAAARAKKRATTVPTEPGPALSPRHRGRHAAAATDEPGPADVDDDRCVPGSISALNSSVATAMRFG